MPLLRISGAVKRNVSEAEITFLIIPAVRFHRKGSLALQPEISYIISYADKKKKKNHIGGDLCPHIQMSLTYSINFY